MRGITIAILGIVAVVAMVGLVFLFTVSKTGAGIYGGAIKGELFPYTRYAATEYYVETPGYQEIAAPSEQVYGGAAREQENLDYERRVTTGSRYKREESRIPTTLTTCMAMKFKDEAGNVIFAPLGVSSDQLNNYKNIKEHCFRYTADGTPVNTRIAKDACCTLH